jgi:hypothetical protein
MLRHIRPWVGFPLANRTRRMVAEYLHQARDARRMQRETLDRLLALNAESDFARERHLRPGMSLSEFRRSVPIADFEAFRPYVERLKHGDSAALLGPNNRLLMFTLSSGTTADSKFIPITNRFVEDYRRGWSMWGIRAMDDHPALHRLDIVQLSSDFDQFRTAGGIPCGNISGLVSAMQSKIVRSMYTVPVEVAKIADPDAKYYTALRLSIANPYVGLVMTANPSTLVHLGKMADRERERLIRDIADGTLAVQEALPPGVRAAVLRRCRRDPARARELERLVLRHGRLAPQDFWPRLALVAVWTGGSAGAYLQGMRRYFGNVPVRDHGLSASEGRMTIPFADERSEGVLDVGTHFFEFIPEEEYGSAQPSVLAAHELQVDRNYYILLTTSSGLYRYDIRDVVRCCDYHGTSPVLEFLHKGAHISNLTGEKVSESQVVSAVRAAVSRLRLELSCFTVSPIWGEPPRYRLHFEAADVPHPGLVRQLVSTVEMELQRLNCEYLEKRHTGRLGELQPQPLPDGTWRRFARHRQSRLGGSVEQYKHPCLSPDLKFSEMLLQHFSREVSRNDADIAAA